MTMTTHTHALSTQAGSLVRLISTLAIVLLLLGMAVALPFLSLGDRFSIGVASAVLTNRRLPGSLWRQATHPAKCADDRPFDLGLLPLRILVVIHR